MGIDRIGFPGDVFMETRAKRYLDPTKVILMQLPPGHKDIVFLGGARGSNEG
jgi:hypothetical protein